MTKHNKESEKLESPDIRKFLNNNTKIIYKKNNKYRLQILEAVTIRKKKTSMNKIASDKGINILN